MHKVLHPVKFRHHSRYDNRRAFEALEPRQLLAAIANVNPKPHSIDATQNTSIVIEVDLALSTPAIEVKWFGELG